MVQPSDRRLVTEAALSAALAGFTGAGGWNYRWPIPPVGTGASNAGGITGPFALSSAATIPTACVGLLWMPGGWTAGSLALRTTTAGAAGETAQIWYINFAGNEPDAYSTRTNVGSPVALDGALGFKTVTTTLAIPEGGLWFGITSTATTARINAGPTIGPWGNWSTGGTLIGGIPSSGPPSGVSSNPDTGVEFAPLINFWRSA